MSDPGVQAFFLLCLEVFAVVTALAIGVALLVRLTDRVRWKNYAAKRATEERQRQEDDNWRARHS